MKNLITFLISLIITNNIYALTVTKSMFDRINKDFENFMIDNSPSTVSIKIYANWEINYPAASTERSTDYEITRHKRPVEWNVSILSGYIQDSDGGLDVHLLTLCHEFAHHIGGAPYKTDDDGNMMGQYGGAIRLLGNKSLYSKVFKKISSLLVCSK